MRLPEDFKLLCAWTDSIEGPGLPMIHHSRIPECFSSLGYGLFTLQGYGPFGPTTVESLMREAYVDDGYEIAAGMQIGAYEGRGAGWLCLCRSENEIEWDDQARLWKWRWGLVKDVHNWVYEDVREMLDESWDQFLESIEADYRDIDVEDLRAIELVDSSVPDSS
ncbi:hypothetical protein BDV97DRAFT_51701 [Delphinella strobiligena]|nr:hypothetical protein BDV97DRAFT_51701 [Delphinella strobiligena]